MADKSFGLKQINMIGVGTPTVESSTDLVINTNGSERIRVDSSGDVGIGTTNPGYKVHIEGTGETALTIEGDASPSDAGGLLILKNNNTTANSINQIQSVDAGGQTTSAISFYNVDNGTNEGYMSFLTRPSGGVPTEAARFTSAGNLRFPSGQGIDFSAASGSAAGSTSALLDDYEEGTHTCTAQNSVTLYSTADQISYTKIGRMVTVGGQIRVNSSNSNSQLELSLPFVCKGNGGEADGLYTGSVRFYSADIANDAVWVIAQSNPGEAKVSFINVRDNTTTSNVAATDNGYYMFTLTYFTA